MRFTNQDQVPWRSEHQLLTGHIRRVLYVVIVCRAFISSNLIQINILIGASLIVIQTLGWLHLFNSTVDSLTVQNNLKHT